MITRAIEDKTDSGAAVSRAAVKANPACTVANIRVLEQVGQIEPS